MSFFVVQKDLKAIHEVTKYVKHDDGKESIWCNTWHGHHTIGVDCFWCKTDTVLERVWRETKSISGFKMIAANSGCSLEEILFFVNMKKKRHKIDREVIEIQLPPDASEDVSIKNLSK